MDVKEPVQRYSYSGCFIYKTNTAPAVLDLEPTFVNISSLFRSAEFKDFIIPILISSYPQVNQWGSAYSVGSVRKN
jgi:hypothetical protein